MATSSFNTKLNIEFWQKGLTLYINLKPVQITISHIGCIFQKFILVSFLDLEYSFHRNNITVKVLSRFTNALFNP